MLCDGRKSLLPGFKFPITCNNDLFCVPVTKLPSVYRGLISCFSSACLMTKIYTYVFVSFLKFGHRATLFFIVHIIIFFLEIYAICCYWKWPWGCCGWQENPRPADKVGVHWGGEQKALRILSAPRHADQVGGRGRTMQLLLSLFSITSSPSCYIIPIHTAQVLTFPNCYSCILYTSLL